jgi:hypothetical protein
MGVGKLSAVRTEILAAATILGCNKLAIAAATASAVMLINPAWTAAGAFV